MTFQNFHYAVCGPRVCRGTWDGDLLCQLRVLTGWFAITVNLAEWSPGSHP